MARRAAKVDRNQPEIVEALRKVGASVAHTHAVHAGFPDLVVGYRSVNYLLEIKDGLKIPSKKKLNAVQVDFHRDWRGSVAVVSSVDEALRAIGIDPD